MRLLEAAYRYARQAIDRAHGYGVINRGGRGLVGLIDVGSVGPLPTPGISDLTFSATSSNSNPATRA